MALQQICLLDCSKTFTSMKWNLEDVLEIEEHIKTPTSCQHPPLEDLVVTGIFGSQISTPLLMACQHGDLEAVKRIIEIWGVNVSTAAANCTIWPNTRVEGVTPLFVASFYHHSKIVKYLIEKGANVNSRTHSTDKKYSGMTPLRAASVSHDEPIDEEKQISTVRVLLESEADPSPLTDDGMPVWHFWLRSQRPLSIQITTLLVEWGMSLTQCTPYSGQTVLHYWVDEVIVYHTDESLGVVQMLLEKGADLQARDNWGFSVILAAANGDGKLPNLTVLDYLLDRCDIPRQDKIDALEAAGAIILGFDENHEKFPLAFQYWRRALTLRRMDSEDCHPLHKTPFKSKSGQLSEWMTLDDLLQIFFLFPARREIQSLLVQFRIFAGLSQGAYAYYMNSVMEYLDRGVGDGRPFTQMMDISLTVMDMIFRCDPIDSVLRLAAIDVINELISIFRNLPNEDPNLNSATLKTLVEYFALTDQLHVPDANQKLVADDPNHIESLKNLVSILSRRPELFTNEMKESLAHMVRRDCRNSDGFNVLLIACSDPDVETLSIVRLLLKFKVDANAVNSVGNGPLHLLAVQVEPPDDIARLLLEAGAHLDMVNKRGMTPADVWLKESSKENWQLVDWRDLPDCLQEDVPSLKCLSARVIDPHRVPYGAILPPVLIRFVSLHSSSFAATFHTSGYAEEDSQEVEDSYEVEDSHEVEDSQEAEDSQKAENSQEVEDSKNLEDAELDELNSKKDDFKLSPEVERDSFDEIEDLNKSPSDKLGLDPASEKLPAKVKKAGGGEKDSLKQTKLNIGASKKVEESESGSEVDEFDMEHDKAAPLREKTKSAAAAKAAIKLDCDSDDSMGGGGAGVNSTNDFVVSDSDEEFARPMKATKHAASSDDDDDPTSSKKNRKAATAPSPPVNKVSSEDLFDLLIGASPKEDPPSPKRAASPVTYDSDSDASFEASKP